MECALNLEPIKSDSISIKYENNIEQKNENNHDILISVPTKQNLVDFESDVEFNVTPDPDHFNDNINYNTMDNNDAEEEESKEFDPIDDEEEFRDLNDTHLHHIRRNLQI